MSRSRRTSLTLIALTAGALLPLSAVPAATAVPAAHRPGTHADNEQRPQDNRLFPLAQKRADLRQTAVDRLASKDARIVGKGANRRIALADGTLVDYPVDQTAQILTFLVQFGGSGSTAETKGPSAGEIPEPEPEDNSNYWQQSFDRQHYVDMFFDGLDDQDGESFKDVYREMSSGRFDLEGDVSDWVTVPQPEAYYGQNDPDSGRETEDKMAAYIGDGAAAWYAAQTGAGKTDAQIKDYLARFDVWDRYDADHDGNYNEPDGYIDHFQAIHAGQGEEAGAAPWTIWSHRSGASYWTDSGPAPCASGACRHQGGVEIGDTGYYILDYTTEPENGGLGVFAHEFGHDLGLPDYYDTTSVYPDNGTGFWNLMSSGSWMSRDGSAISTTPNHMGATEKYFLGWYGDDLATVDGTATTPATVTLGPSYHATSGRKQAVLVGLPEGHRVVHPDFAGSADGDYLYFGSKALTNATATSAPLTVPADDPVLSARVAYDIEEGYDYAYLEVSDDGGDWTPVDTSLSTTDDPNAANQGFGITGDSGGFTTLTADLNAYVGDSVRLRWRYVTDPATTLLGLAVDGVTLGDHSTAYSPNDWTLDHAYAVVGGAYTVDFEQYYLAENRQYRGYDRTLEDGPYSALSDTTVEHFPYQDGLLVWYHNGFYADNDTAVHPGGGLNLPVDANPTLQSWAPDSHSANAITEGRLQAYDSTFDVDTTDALVLDGGDARLTASHPSVPVFEDTDPDAYLRAGPDEIGLRFSTEVAGAGAMIQVVSSDEGTGTMVLKVGKRFVAALGNPVVSGTAAVGETLTVTTPTWFQPGVTASVAWLRDGQPTGATGPSYVLQPRDGGHTIAARVAGTKDGYGSTSVTSASRTVAPGSAPRATKVPRLTGTARVGGVLRVTRATWPHAGTSTFRWTVGGRSVATGTSYAVKPADVGKRVVVTETFTSAGYAVGRASAQSAPVTKATVTLSVRPGSARKGKRVTVVIRASAPGVTVPGRVVIRYDGHTVAAARLVHGRTTVRLPAKKRGGHRLRVTYGGASAFDRASKAVRVHVR